MLEKCKLLAIFCSLFHNPWPQPRELEDQTSALAIPIDGQNINRCDHGKGC